MASKVKKGTLAVCVGLEGEEGERFVIPIPHLHHPLFKSLLETSREVYGYPSSGPLRLPCTVEEFIHIGRLIERESPRQHSHGSHNNHHQVHHHHLASFSMHSF